MWIWSRAPLRAFSTSCKTVDIYKINSLAIRVQENFKGEALRAFHEGVHAYNVQSIIDC